jgi:hypothetical protein
VPEFDQPLRLTSPLTQGQKVKDAQWLMAGNNRFPGLATFKDGVIDGAYGELSAAATWRTKYWLGYPDNSLDKIFGQTIYEYLRPNNWRPLPTLYRERREARLKAAAQTPGVKALAQAVTHLGYHEVPNNWTVFGRQYGMDGEPWCAIFESCMFRDSGYVTSTGRWRFRYSYVPTIYEDARHARNGLHLVSTPRPGDLALFDISGETLAHTAFVRTAPSGGYFEDLGGNTSEQNMANGGYVASKRRTTRNVHAWVRVG